MHNIFISTQKKGATVPLSLVLRDNNTSIY